MNEKQRLAYNLLIKFLFKIIEGNDYDTKNTAFHLDRQ